MWGQQPISRDTAIAINHDSLDYGLLFWGIGRVAKIWHDTLAEFRYGDLRKFLCVQNYTKSAMRKSVEENQNASDNLQIGVDVQAMVKLQKAMMEEMPGGEEQMERLWQEEFLHYLPGIQNDDFIGVQNYTRELVGMDGSLPVPIGADLTQSGYEFYPEALEHVIRKVAKDYKGSLFITENGVAMENDQRRVEYFWAA